jgi:flagellar hook-associated protein 2
VSVDKDGNFTFDKTKFATAYAADPNGVANLFSQSSSSSSGSMSFVSATSTTRGGTYAVNITRAATQATAQSAGLPAVGTTISARVNGVVAAYTVQAGDTIASVTAGLNTAFAAQNLGLVASVNGTNVMINTARYGSQASMDVAWNGTSYVTSTGNDVAGTINGVAATGVGQVLAAPQSDPTLSGLAIQVTGTATGAIGTFTYTPGIAARIDQMITDATDPLTGYITSAETGHKDNEQLISDQVDQMTTSLNAYQDRLKSQFASLEALLATMKNQGSFLSAQIGAM